MNPKKLLKSVVTSALVLTGGALVACGDPEEETPLVPGPESGVYYNYDGSSTRSLSLSDGDQAALQIDGASMSGTYAVDGATLRFNLSDVGELAGTLENDAVTLTYNSEQIKFWKDIDYTVTYETFGGSAVAQSNVKYGQVLVAPSAPTRGNDAFLGWTTVAHGETLYSFTEHVGGSMTLYAKWVEATDNEYVISYDLGYEGAAALPSALTAAGRAYNLPTPTRSGYTFKGWWVSQYHSADKLSYRCNEGVTEFGADTTLFAKWQADGESNPDITVTSSGISWERMSSEVRVIVRGPEGYGNNGATDDRFGASGATSKAIDFTQSPAGDYEITLETGGNTYKVYYKNKAVNDVSRMHVVNNNQLEYSAVSGADKYYVTVDCGTPGHDHVMIDNGNNTTYNFSACDMKPEGITFIVYAAANGKAMSAGRTLNHEAHLAAVSMQSYALDAETGVLSWSEVEHATSYAVSVNGGAAQEVTATNFNINNYDGEVSVSVVPKGHGYNPGEAAVYSYTRTTLSTPQNLHIEGSTLKWTGATGASGYEIRVGNVTLTSTAPEIDLNAANIEWQESQEYDISVRSVGANGANASYWSDKTSAVYNTATSPTPRYSASTLSWAYAIGVDHYEVRINDGEILRVADNFVNDVVLTQRGLNVIRLRSVTADGPNEWKELQVMAYELEFQLNGVSYGRYYKATGDKIDLPDLSRPGYDFTGWRTASVNGSAYEQDTFTATTNLVLHASYAPHNYTVNLNFGSYGLAPGAQTTTTIAYDSDSYTLPVPNITDGRMQFIGWNTSSLGNGVAYADDKGAAVTTWNNPVEGFTVYAVYAEALTFVEDGDGYSVSAGREIGRVSNLIIPATYNGKKVRSLGENAFKNCKSLVSVTIPSTVQAIPETAFDSCNIQKYMSTVIASDPDPVFEATEDGVLLRHNYATGALDLMFVPEISGDRFRVPGGVTNLRSKVFDRLSVSEIVIPASVSTIEVDAFYNCTNLTKVTFEEGAGSALTINARAFSGCANITELTLPGRLAAWGENGDVASVLSNFAKLKKITVVGVNNNSTYSSDANGMLFSGNGDTLLFCPRACELTEYVVPSTVLYIGDGAFASVSVSGVWQSRSLTSVTFHNQMRGIGDKAFYRATKLNTVTFEAAATAGNGIAIGVEAFYGCSGITTLDFRETGALDDSNVYVATTTCSVASIGENAFGGIRAATIVLPSTLTSIGNNAFSSNNMLTALDLGHINDSLEFGTNVFSGNTKLASVEITPNIGVIEFSSVFRGCDIKEYDVSNNPRYAVDEVTNSSGEVVANVIYDGDYKKVVYIPDNVNLATYTFRDTLEEIPGGLFNGRDDLTEFVVPSAVKNIGANAFQNCANLQSLTFAPGTAELTIGANAFSGCANLTEISIPGRTIEIGANAFSGTGIVTATFEEGVTAIPERAFYNVSSLTTVNIASTVSRIYESAFYGTGLTTVNFASPAPGVTLTSLVISSQAFANCASLQTIDLPEGLQYVSESMFANCAALTHVTIPTTVKNISGEAGIGRAAFYNCQLLSNIEFTDGGSDAVSFGEYSLYNTMALTTIDLPYRAAPLTSGGYDVFQKSSKTGYTDSIGVFDQKGETSNAPYLPKFNLQKITIGGQANGSGTYFSTYGGVLYSANHERLVLCPQYYDEETVTISKYATRIETGAFKGCSLIENIEFEAAGDRYDDDGVTELPDFVIPSAGNGANSANTNLLIFRGCTSITSIAFPRRLTEIGDYAFWKTAGSNTEYPYLTSITFADGCKLTRIGEGAFINSGIQSIVLPENLEEIGARAFYSSSRLETVTWSNKLKTIESDPRVETTTTKRNGAFEGTKLTGALNLPDTLIYIGDYAFRNLSGVTSVHIPTGVTSSEEGAGLGVNVFYGTGITEVTVPSSLPIDSNSKLFEKCNSLTSITFDGDVANYNVIINMLSGTPAGVQIDFINTTEANTLEYVDGILYGKVQNDEGAFTGERSIVFCSKDLELDELVITANVIEIAPSAFFGTTGIQSFTFEASETPIVIGESAFENTKAVSIDISGRSLSNNTFGDAAFRGSALETVLLPTSLTTLPQNAFRECSALKTVSFGGSESNLTSIGFCAFYNCTSFTGTSETEFVLPNNVTTFGNYAFGNCSSLENFILPTEDNGWTTISDYMFDGCESLRFIGKKAEISEGVATKTYGLPTTITIIGKAAFQNCKQLGNYIETTDEDGTTSYSKTLESLIPNSVNKITIIEQYAFKNCQSLVTIYIPNSVLATSFGRTSSNTASSYNVTATTDVQVFYGCTSLETVTFGETSKIQIIGKNAFYGCTHLKDVNLPKTTTTLGESAFENCGSELPDGEVLTVSVPGTALASICKAAFKGSGIGSFTFKSSMKNFGGTSKVTDANTDSEIFMDCKRLTSVDMSACTNSSVSTAIGKRMFFGCTSLTEVKLFAKLASVGEDAFGNCTSLESIEFNNSAALTIKSHAFAGCSNLAQVKINGSKGVTFEANAFSDGGSGEEQKGCPNLSEIWFGATAATQTITVNDGAFNGCANSGNVAFGGSLNKTADGGLYALDESKGTKTFIGYNGGAVETFTIAAGTTNIGANALLNNTTITNLVIPSSVTTFGSTAFKGSSLVSVTFGYGAAAGAEAKTDIGSNAFQDCTSLVSVDLTGVKSIGSNAFKGAGVTPSADGTTKFEIVIPSSVKDIGASAFDSSKVVSVTLNATYNPETFPSSAPAWFNSCEYLKSVEIGSGVKKLGKNVFKGCSALTSVTFADNSVTVLGNANGYSTVEGVFANCTSLTSISLPSSLVDIGGDAFYGCSSLTSVNIGKAQLTNISPRAFQGCAATFKIEKHSENAAVELLDNGRAVVFVNGNVKTLAAMTGGCSYYQDGVFTMPTDKGITVLGARLFYNDTTLTKAVITNDINRIGKEAFYFCSNLSSIMVGDEAYDLSNVEYFEYGAFQSSGITTVNFENAKEIYSYAFKDCASLECEITLGSDVTFKNLAGSTAGYIFSSTKLSKVTLDTDADAFDATIGSNMFYNCKNLSSVSIGDNVNIIADSMFSSCTALTGTLYMKNVTYVGKNAFSSCKATAELCYYIDGQKVTTIGSSAFPATSNGSIRLYVVGMKQEDRPSTWSGVSATATYVKYQLNTDGTKSFDTPDGWSTTTSETTGA